MDFHIKATIFLIFIDFFTKSIDGQSICADRTYFNYECSQLARYCRVNRAVGIRSSCPLTCGLCQKDQPNAAKIGAGTEKESGSGIIRFFPQSGDSDGDRRESIAETTTATILPPQVDTLKSIIFAQTTTTRLAIIESSSKKKKICRIIFFFDLEWFFQMLYKRRHRQQKNLKSMTLKRRRDWNNVARLDWSARIALPYVHIISKKKK